MCSSLTLYMPTTELQNKEKMFVNKCRFDLFPMHSWSPDYSYQQHKPVARFHPFILTIITNIIIVYLLEQECQNFSGFYTVCCF